MGEFEWQDVAAHVQARMVELRLDQLTLAERAGVSPQTVRDLQRGHEKAYHPRTLACVAKALGWPLGAFPRLLMGLPPTDRQDLAATA